MKKSLLIAAIAAIGAVDSNAQVTQISSNKGLQFVGAISNKGVFVSETDNHLWISDGTAAGTTLLSSTIAHEAGGMMVNNKAIFRGTTPATGSEMFVTDGTPAGTILLKDIYPGTTGSAVGDDMAVLNGFIYFTATNPANGREIWKTDGTPAGTTLLKDIVAGPGNSNIATGYNLFSNGSYLLFNAQTPASGTEVWKSDGTDAGTALLKDVNPGASSSNASVFFQLGSIVLFGANHATYGEELWKTDGTAAGTVLVEDIYAGPVGSASMLSTFFYEFNGRAYFNATNGINGEELWSTDGTAANTNMIKDIQAGPNGSFNLLINAMKVGNKFIFPSTNLFGTRYQLWESDGTTAGTNLFKDFSYDDGELPLILATYAANGNSFTQPLFQGNKFFFMAKTENEGYELWVSNGTIAGTNMVKDINVGAGNGIENLSYQYTSTDLYFSANDGVNGEELWKTNGTGSGTAMVADIRVGTQGSVPTLWPIVNGKLFITANNGDNVAADLYVLNGTVIPLPIKLGDIRTTQVGKDAKIEWYTLQEKNSKEFIVQRSEDGAVFSNIGTVKAAGESNSKVTYSFTDADILSNGKKMIYYRLLMIDKDERSTLSKIVSLRGAGTNWNVQLLQNPVQANAQISLTGLTEKASIKVTDINGRTLRTSFANGNGIKNISTTNFAKGCYYIIIESENERQVKNFIKE